MNIDERLARLVERHEALTQSLELLSHHTQSTDSRLDRIAEHAQGIDRRLDRIADFLDRLSHIVEIHERRLNNLEGD